jgi:hypothetical protein
MYREKMYIGRISNFDKEEMELKIDRIGREYQIMKDTKKETITFWATKIEFVNEEDTIIKTLEI